MYPWNSDNAKPDTCTLLALPAASAPARNAGNAAIGASHGVAESGRTTEQTVAVMDTSSRRAGQSGEALRRIQRMAARTVDEIQAIARAVDGQSRTSHSAADTVERIKTLSDETSRNMASSAEAIADLARLAKELDAIIESMREGKKA